MFLRTDTQGYMVGSVNHSNRFTPHLMSDLWRHEPCSEVFLCRETSPVENWCHKTPSACEGVRFLSPKELLPSYLGLEAGLPFLSGFPGAYLYASFSALTKVDRDTPEFSIRRQINVARKKRISSCGCRLWLVYIAFIIWGKFPRATIVHAPSRVN